MKIEKVESNEDKKCYKETKSKPTSYYCEDNATLEKDKCVNKQIEDPEKRKSMSYWIY